MTAAIDTNRLKSENLVILFDAQKLFPKFYQDHSKDAVLMGRHKLLGNQATNFLHLSPTNNFDLKTIVLHIHSSGDNRNVFE